MVGKLWYLKKFNLLADLDREEIQKLAEQTRMERYESDRTIYLPGSSANTVYLLKEGRVKLSRVNEEGKRITVALMEPGEVFGELSLPGEREHATEAKSVEESLVCWLPSDKFRDFLSGHPELNFEVTRFLGKRRRNIESKMENLIFRDATERLCYVLEDLFENHAPPQGEKDGPSINFSHQELAELAGLTRPTTTRLLNKLAEEDIVDLERRNIVLTDPDRLRREQRA